MGLDQPSAKIPNVARDAGVVSLAVTASRILGLVRDQVFAIFFGAGLQYDAFLTAFRIPNLLRDLFDVPGKADLTVQLTRVMIPFLLLIALAAQAMGMLNARNVFGIPALASAFFNVG